MYMLQKYLSFPFYVCTKFMSPPLRSLKYVLLCLGESVSVLGPSARNQVSLARPELPEQADGTQREQDH